MRREATIVDARPQVGRVSLRRDVAELPPLERASQQLQGCRHLVSFEIVLAGASAPAAVVVFHYLDVPSVLQVSWHPMRCVVWITKRVISFNDLRVRTYSLSFLNQ